MVKLLKDNFIKMIFRYLLIQIVLLLLFIAVFLPCLPINKDSVKSETIIVEGFSMGQRRSTLTIWSDKGLYKFYSSRVGNEFSNSTIARSVSIGDQLDIMYYEGYSWFILPTNWIVAARNGHEAYRTIDGFYASRENLATNVLAVGIVVELFFLVLTFLLCWIFRQDIRMQYKIFCKKVAKIKNRKDRGRLCVNPNEKLQ